MPKQNFQDRTDPDRHDRGDVIRATRGKIAVTEPSPSFAELVRTFARIGCLSFGGPAGQIALMHREIVEQRRWVDEDSYLHALNVCMLLPGPEAQQLATWIGWRLHGARGGLAAGLLFVLPGAFVMLVLSALYAAAAGLAWFAALFLGIKAAVLAIVVHALIRIGRRALDTGLKRGIALAAFVALFAINAPFPLVVLGAGAIGIAVAAWRPALLALAPSTGGDAERTPLPIGRTVRTVILWLAVWATPMAVVLVLLGPDHVLWKIGLFFSRLAVVTFGGAYAVLAYMAQQAVQTQGWLQPGEMADGLGLAETTPGPLILVTQFVGYLAAFRAPAPFTPFVAGVLGAGLTIWVTFAPCFLWIFALAPWIDRARNATRLKGGLAAITAAVVGVIANLSLWFALHVLFRRAAPVAAGPITLAMPDWTSLNLAALALSVLAAVLLFRTRLGMLATLTICAAAGLGIGAMAG